MLEFEEAIRVATFNALNGNVFFDSNAVSVYDDMAPDDAPFPFIILGDTSSIQQTGTKQSYRTDATQDIKITSRFDNDVTKNVTSSISNQVCDILIPSPQGPFLDLSPGFLIIVGFVSYRGSLSYSDGRYRYIDRNLRIQYSIEQRTQF